MTGKHYRLAIWDFDGTLADTLSSGLGIYNQLAERYGFLAVEDPDSVRSMTTSQFRKAHNIPAWKVPILVADFLAMQKQVMPQVPLCPGVEAIIRGLQKVGCTQGIVSSNSENNIRTCLRANDVETVFGFVAAMSRLFGKQRAIRQALNQRGVEPEGALYIGDEVRDIEAARQAGIDVAVVTWGVNSKELLTQHDPDFLIEQPDQLFDVIRA